MKEIKKQKVLLMIVLFIVSTLMIISGVNAGFSIRIEKDLPMSEVLPLPTTLTINIYDNNTTTLVATQDYASGEWEADYDFTKYPGGDMVRFRVDFTDTDTLTKEMDLSVEMKFDDVTKGPIVKLKQELRALFAEEALLADDADTVDGAHAASLEESAEIDADILTHAGDTSSHHTRYTESEAIAAMGSMDNANPLNHDRRTDGQVFGAVLSWDGAGSTLDADLLDGQDSNSFATSSHDHLGDIWPGGTSTYGLRAETSGMYGLYGLSSMTGGRGVLGHASATTGTTYGVRGISDSTSGYGVTGYASATTGPTHAVYGSNYSTSGYGVRGVAFAPTGTTYGVYGESYSPDGWGLYTPDAAYVGGELEVYGRVGIGTANPQTALDVVGGGSITGDSNEYFWLNRIGSDGYGFFGYDTFTNALQFGAYETNVGWRNVIIVGSNLGIGTIPNARLHIGGTPGVDGMIFPDGSLQKTAFTVEQIEDGDWTISGNNMYSGVSGRVGIGTSSPSQKLHVEGNIYASGSITPGSSRELKENIQALSTEEAITALNKLYPQKFYYKADNEDEHVGFIAEDVPELVATKDRKGVSSMDVVAVLTKVVQEQEKTITELKEEMKELKREMKLKGSMASVIN